MARNASRDIDKTFLSLDLAEERGLIHRDYLAHCTRWSHVVKFLNKGHAYKDAVVLDVGCGKEMPMAKLLYVNKMSPLGYVGVDANKMQVPEMLAGKKMPVTLWSETDFCSLDADDVSVRGKLPNIVTCFEVLEHVMPEHCRRMLVHFKEVTSDDCHYFISTPCWNGSAAQNHINEMTFAALGGLVEDLGYDVQGVYGTFASISDYKPELAAFTYSYKGVPGHNIMDLRPLFEILSSYYDTNVLAILFAPLFPAHARNCLWHLTKKKGDAANQDRLFSALDNAPRPWSQHPRWEDLKG